MAIRSRARVVAAFAGALALTGAGAAARAAMPCPVVSLKGATGVIGEAHGYQATGRCEKKWSKTETSMAGFVSSTTNLYMGLEFSGKASWNRDTGLAEESLSFQGLSPNSPTGKRTVSGICSQDPFLIDPPGGAASCHSVTAQAKVSSGPLYEFLVEKSFWLGRHFALAEAQALSQQAAANPPKTAQPPPPKKKPPALKDAKADEKQKAALATAVLAAMPKPAPVGLEAEAMLGASRAFAHGGAVAAQPMSGFGAGWSGGSQLFWSGGQVGSWLDLVIDVPASGSYSLALYLTRAPDYAQLKVEVDGESGVRFDGFSKRVEPSGPVRVGTFELQAGPRRVRLTITGKHADSRGLLVGVDRMDLLPVGGG
jgi:hypothetical protein